MAVRKLGVACLLGASLLLGACFPVSSVRNEPPAIRGHAADAGRAGDAGVLVLAISLEYRAGALAALGGSSGYSRHVQFPIFVPEQELKIGTTRRATGSSRSWSRLRSGRARSSAR